MNKPAKVAILISQDSNLTFELEELQAGLKAYDIETQIFLENESILDYQPDCVFITSPQLAKLTPFPTYGLIHKSRAEYLELPRFVRNILTYDGCFTTSPTLKQMLGDLYFGARKIDSDILNFDFYPRAKAYREPSLDFYSEKIVIFEPDYTNSRYKDAISYLLEKISHLYLLTFSSANLKKYNDRVIVVEDNDALEKILTENRVTICLNSAGPENDNINTTILKLVAAGTIPIVQHTPQLENIFTDNLYYIPQDTMLGALHKAIEYHLREIKKHPLDAIRRSQAAYQIFLQEFSFEVRAPQFFEFHQKTLLNKGYIPHPDVEKEKNLPSVTYIMRTGGKHRHFLERALNCLVAQQYPDLRVIFVVHAKFPYINEIIEKYPGLKIKVIESIKSMRSEAIRDGMAAVETELFGLFDDDDELFPNHVRMLVKALQYHAHRDWRGEISMVYSGSIRADDTYIVAEQGEFLDYKIIPNQEKRAIEHFRFYSSAMMAKHMWFMPNGWLARSKFIDEELLADPELNTCEDLYFELQLAQRGHFAFSAEVTAIHHFHHFGNSTFVDSHQHLPDTQRIALRNFSRVFPQDSVYDIAEPFRLIGKCVVPQATAIAYQDKSAPPPEVDYSLNQFYPHRRLSVIEKVIVSEAKTKQKPFRLFHFISQVIHYSYKFLKLDSSRKWAYFTKLNNKIREVGYWQTFQLVKEKINANQIVLELRPEKSRSNIPKIGLMFFWFKWLRFPFRKKI